MAAFLTDYEAHVAPVVPRPELDVPYTDSVFGSTIVRITDPSLSPGSQGIIHEYSRYPIPSADNQFVVTVVIGGPERGQWRVMGIRDHIVKLNIDTDGDPEFSWHPTDPTKLFYRFANDIRVVHIDTGQIETLMSFDGYAFVSSNEEGRPSDDWRYYAAIGVKGDETRDILVADLTTKTVIGKLENVGENIDWVGMSPSGAFVLAMYTDGRGTLVYNRAMVAQRQALSDYAHSDFAVGVDGQDYLVYVASSGPQVSELGCPRPPNGSPLAAVRLFDAKKTILLGDCSDADWKAVIIGSFLGWGGAYHFSGIISRSRPGWVLVSSYAAPDVPQEPFSREIFLVSLDGSGAVERLAHHQSLVANLPSGERDYFAEPHASSSWDGSLVLFASTWGQTGQHYDLYSLTQTGGGTPPSPPIPPIPPIVPPTELTAPYATAVLTWQWTSAGYGPIKGFRVKCGLQSGNPTAIKMIKDTDRRSIALRNVVPVPGRYFCTISAVGIDNNESLPSPEIIINATGVTPPLGPLPNPVTDIGVKG